MNSPLDRARVLDAEMQLQRAWLELSLRDMTSGSTVQSPWSVLGAFKFGKLGMSLLKNRSLWLAIVGLVANLVRRRTQR